MTNPGPAPPQFTLRRSILFSAFLFACFFGAVELVLRVVGIAPVPRPGILLHARDVDITFPFMRSDPVLFWAPRPGFQGDFLDKPVSINRLGLRGSDPQQPKRGRLLAERRVETVNAGVTGYTSHQVLALLRRISPVIQADVATFCIGWNDGNRRPLDDREYARRLAVATRTDGLLDQVYLYQFLKSLYVRAAIAPTTGAGRVERVPPDQYQENLAAIVAECRARNIRPVFVALPHRKLAGEATLASVYPRLLRATAASLEVPLVDARDLTLESPLPDTSTLFIDSLHFSVTGNTLMADQLARQLVALGVI